MKTLKLIPIFFLLAVAAFGQVNIGIYPLATASGTDTYTATVTPTFTAYVSGQRFNIKFTNANTGASTININSKGVVPLVKTGSTALSGNDIKAGEIKLLVYDGTNMQIIGGGGGSSYTASNGITLTGTNFKLGGALAENTLITGLGFGIDIGDGIDDPSFFNVSAGNVTIAAGGNGVIMDGTIPRLTTATTNANVRNIVDVAYADTKVAKTTTIAGVDLVDNVTGTELRTALAQISDVAYWSYVATYTNAPNSEFWGAALVHPIMFDASAYQFVRISVYVRIASTSVNSPRLYPQYSTDNGSSWITIGAGTIASGDAISLEAPGSINRITNWIALPAGAKADVIFRIAQNGGDGINDPQLTAGRLQFKN